MATDARPKPVVVLIDATAFGDDGVAIAMLLAAPSLDVKLIACASGNVWAEEVEVNVRSLLARLGRNDVPVCLALPGQALSERVATFVAQSRLVKPSYAGALAKPVPLCSAEARRGFAEVAATLMAMPDATLLVMAPVSPLAAALREQPQLARWPGKVLMMGGALEVPGNATHQAEFNVWFDPEAADAVLNCGFDITLAPLDATDHLRYPHEALHGLDRSKPALAYLLDYMAFRRHRSRYPTHVWDEALSAILLDPDLILESSQSPLRVETHHNAQYGRLLTAPGSGRPVVTVIRRLDGERLAALVLKTLAQ